MKKNFLFTSESVSEGHPDKVADQISDALIDNFLAFDKNSKVACETLVTTGQVILAGEVKSKRFLKVVHATFLPFESRFNTFCVLDKAIIFSPNISDGHSHVHLLYST